MELETIVENGHIEEELENPSPAWSFGEWKDMFFAETEILNYYSDPPRSLTPLPAGVEREFDEDEWEELVAVPFSNSLYLMNLVGDEINVRKDDSGSKVENGDGQKKGKKKKQPRCQTKVILRRLPPTMSEGEFQAIMSPLPPYNYFNYCKADRSLGIHERTFVIINFISELDAHDFIERYHDCIFYDSKGNEYVSVCHLAPSQSIPVEKEKNDQLAETMKETMAWKSFFSTYEESPETLFAVPVSEDGPVTLEMMAEELEMRPKHGPESTPLLDYIRETICKPQTNSVSSYKDSPFSKKSSLDKMRTIKKDKRKERRDRERKEKKEKDVKSKKLKTKPYSDEKHEPSSSKDQDSSGPSSKSESIEASTSGISSNPSVTSNSKETSDKRPLDTSTTKESKFNSDFKPKTSFTDRKPRTFKGSDVVNKVKDKTRWSKNSGLRTHYDDKSFTKTSDKKSGRSSKTDKPRRPSLVSEKEESNKAPTVPEKDDANREKQSSNEGSKSTAATDSKPAEFVSKTATENANADSSAGPSSSTGKKVIIKKVIKKVRRVRTDEEGPTKFHDESSSAFKKTASVKKVTPTGKSKDDTCASGKSGCGAGDTKEAHRESVPGKTAPEKPDSNKDSTASNSSRDKEKRVRKGRPDLQIYRPGSLRSATSKSGECNTNGNNDAVKKDK